MCHHDTKGPCALAFGEEAAAACVTGESWVAEGCARMRHRGAGGDGDELQGIAGDLVELEPRRRPAPAPTIPASRLVPSEGWRCPPQPQNPMRSRSADGPLRVRWLICHYLHT